MKQNRIKLIILPTGNSKLQGKWTLVRKLFDKKSIVLKLTFPEILGYERLDQEGQCLIGWGVRSGQSGFSCQVSTIECPFEILLDQMSKLSFQSSGIRSSDLPLNDSRIIRHSYCTSYKYKKDVDKKSHQYSFRVYDLICFVMKQLITLIFYLTD